MLEKMDDQSCNPKRQRLEKPPPPPPDNIPAIFKLNDDCLLEVLKYLDIDDVINVLQTDNRFRSAVDMRVTQKELFQIGYSSWKIPEFVDVFAKRATRFWIDSTNATKFVVEKMPLFENLKELFVGRELSHEEIRASPQNLETLKLYGSQTETLSITEWFRLLNPTLRELIFKYPNNCIESLKELNNLETLEIWLGGQKDIVEFIQQNQNLRQLMISFFYVTDLKGFSRLTQLHLLKLNERKFNSLDQLTEIVPQNLRRLIVASPELTKWEDCAEEAVQEITTKLQETIPGLTVEITDPFVYEEEYDDPDDNWRNSDFYYGSD